MDNSKTDTGPRFSLDHEFDEYLRLAYGNRRHRMPPYQIKEIRRAFYGACGRLLILQRDKIARLPYKQAVESYQDMWNQVANFWTKETNKQN